MADSGQSMWSRLETNDAQGTKCLRDIVALSTLPALWAGADPLRIAESLAASLFTILDPEFVYILLKDGSGKPPVAVAQTERYHSNPLLAQTFGSVLLDWARHHDPDELLSLPNPLGPGTLRATTRPVGPDAELGVVAAAFADQTAPTSAHHLLLNVGASQAAMAVSNARLLRSLRESEQRAQQAGAELAERVTELQAVNVQLQDARRAALNVMEDSLAARQEAEQATAALRESEERFRAIVETTPECVKLVAPDGTLLHMNSSGLTMVGADRAEMVIRKSVYDLIAPEDRDRFRAFNERICRGEKGSLEFDIVGLQGARRHMETQSAPFRKPEGGVVQLAVTRDITERKQAELERDRALAAVQNERTRLHDLFMAAPAIICVLRGPEHTFELANPLYLRLVGRSGREEVLGRPVRDLLPEAEGQGHFEILDRVYQTGEPFIGKELPVRLDRRGAGDLEELFFNFVYQPTRDVSGAIDGILVHAVDVTEQVRARRQVEGLVEKLAHERDLLCASEQFNRSIVESSSDCIKMLDLKGNLLSMSPGGQKLLCISDIGLYLNRSWISFWEGEDNEGARSAVQAAAAGGTGHFVGFFRTLAGEPKWWDVVVTPIFDQHGKPERLLAVSRDVTERRETEEALARISAESDKWRRLYETVLANTPDLGFVFDLNHRFTYANQALLAMWGRTWDEAIGKNCLELGYPPWHAAMHDREIEQVIAAKQPIRGEVPFTGTHGRRIYDYIFFPVIGRNGEVEAVAGTTRDITERKQAEDERQKLLNDLQAERRLLDSVLQQLPSGVFIATAAGKLVMANRKVQEILGHPFVPAEGIQDVARYSVLHMDGRPYKAEEFPLARSLTAGETVLEEEVRYPRPNGTEVVLTASSAPVRDKNGEIVAGVVVLNDVTEKRKAREDLRQSEQRFLQLAETIPQLAWIANPDGWIFWYNQRWYTFTGTTPEEMQGWGWQTVHHPDHIHRVVEHWRQCLTAGQAWEDTFPLRGRNGDYRWFLSRALPFRDEQGRVVRWFGTNTDITDQLQTQEELRRANQDLEQFAYSASHDLQEPLRSVSIYSELLSIRYRERLDGQALEFLDFLRTGAKRMEMLVRDLLAFTRVNKLEVTGEKSDANQEVAAVLANLDQAVRESGAQITLGPLPVIPIQRVYLQQLFQNLIGNALKYHSPDRPPVIHVGAERQNGHWLFSVSDKGIGIDPEYKERIFELFKRLHTGDEYSGTGLGLAICKRIVERYRGRIWVESAPGEGSTFYFILPA